MGKNKALYILIGLFIVGVLLIALFCLEREPDSFVLTPPWEGEIKEVFWIDNNNLLITLISREGEGETESRIYQLDPFNDEATEIFSSRGWRLDLEILDFTKEKDLIAIKDGDKIKIINFAGETQFSIEEAGTNAQAYFSPDLERMAFTTFAEWELPTNAFVLDLQTWEFDQLTDYEFGQNYKTGKIGWDQAGNFYFVEEFAFGTLTIGGQRLFSIEAGQEKELFWEVPGAEQVIGFSFLENSELLCFFVEWDDAAMETQLFLGRFDAARNQKDWIMALDSMGDRELWKEIKPGYPTEGEVIDETIWVTGIKGGEAFQILQLDLGSGEIKQEISQAGSPRISPDKEWMVFYDFSADEPLLKVGPLTNSGNLR